MKIVAISDTHGLHDQLVLPDGDLLIHTGDISKRGRREEIVSFLEWFDQQPFPYKVFIAGNHDFYLEEANEKQIASLMPSGISYLNDSGIEIDGCRIWGSPVQPWFHDWAFNRQRGDEIDRHWQLVPEGVDLLLTHGPPWGVLDRTFRGMHVGCERLLDRIINIRPGFVVFGHIHEAYGQLKKNNIHFINASVVNLRYQVVNPPVVFEFEDI